MSRLGRRLYEGICNRLGSFHLAKDKGEEGLSSAMAQLHTRVAEEERLRSSMIDDEHERELSIKRLSKARERMKRDVRTRNRLANDIRSCGLLTSPSKVRLTAQWILLISISLSLSLVFLVFLATSQPRVLIFGLPIATILSLTLRSYILSYPTLLIKRIRTKAIGASVDLVNHIVISMHLSPSLDRALSAAEKNVREPVASMIRRTLWGLYLREYDSVEGGFAAFSAECGRWDRNVERSLQTIYASTLEKDNDRANEILEKSSESLRTAMKDSIQKYTSSLRGPTMILFAVGVLLPMILGAILPIMSVMNVSDLMRLEGEGEGDCMSNLLTLVGLMNLAFPLSTLLYAYHTLSGKPEFSAPVEIAFPSGWTLKAVLVIIATLPVLTIEGLFFPLGGYFGPFLILFSIALPSGAYLFFSTRRMKRERRGVLTLEREFPSALYQIGCRIAEGVPFEGAIRVTADTMRGTKICEFLAKISDFLYLSDGDLEDALIGKGGYLSNHPSRMVSGGMRAAIHATKKDPLSSGKTIMRVAQQLGDSEDLKNHARKEIGSTLGTIKSTTLFFSPIVLGMTSSLYLLLSSAFQSIGAGSFLPGPLFTIILGIFLFESTVVTAFFVTGIEESGNKVEFANAVGASFLCSSLIFCLSALASSFGLGLL